MLVPYSTSHVVAVPSGLTLPETVAVVGPVAVTGPVVTVGAVAARAEAAPASAAREARRTVNRMRIAAHIYPLTLRTTPAHVRRT